MRQRCGCGMSAADIAKTIAKIGFGAVEAGLAAALDGGTADEALMAMAEHIANERAAAKFAEFQDK